MERTRVRRQEVEEAGESNEEEAGGGVVAGLINLKIETTGIYEEAAESSKTTLEMEVEETGKR